MKGPVANGTVQATMRDDGPWYEFERWSASQKKWIRLTGHPEFTVKKYADIYGANTFIGYRK